MKKEEKTRGLLVLNENLGILGGVVLLVREELSKKLFVELIWT